MWWLGSKMFEIQLYTCDDQKKNIRNTDGWMLLLETKCEVYCVHSFFFMCPGKDQRDKRGRTLWRAIENGSEGGLSSRRGPPSMMPLCVFLPFSLLHCVGALTHNKGTKTYPIVRTRLEEQNSWKYKRIASRQQPILKLTHEKCLPKRASYLKPFLRYPATNL